MIVNHTAFALKLSVLVLIFAMLPLYRAIAVAMFVTWSY